MRVGRCAHHRPARSRHRLQLCHVLLAHAGSGQAAQEAAPSAARRTAPWAPATWPGPAAPATDEPAWMRHGRYRRRWRGSRPVRRRRRSAAKRGRSAGQHDGRAGRQPADERHQEQSSQRRGGTQSR